MGWSGRIIKTHDTEKWGVMDASDIQLLPKHHGRVGRYISSCMSDCEKQRRETCLDDQTDDDDDECRRQCSSCLVEMIGGLRQAQVN